MKNDSEIKYAGFFGRLAVFLIDLLIISFLLYALTHVFGNEGIRIGSIVTAWLYWAISLSMWRTTLGGKLLAIEICSTDGSPLSFARASIRFFVSIVPFALYLFWRGMQHSVIPAPSPTMQMLPQLVYLLPPFLIFFTDKRQMIHDIVAGSIVLDVSKRSVDKNDTSIHIVSLGQKILRVIVIGVFLLVFGYVLIYTSVFFMLGKHQHDAYNASFHTTYPVNDHNDSTIVFYHRELQHASKAFVEADGMYEIFEADVKRDLAVNCIEYLLRADHNVSEWIEEGSRFRKNARNKYANTKEKIAKAKANEDYMGRHFYDYDLNDVNEIEDHIADPFGGNGIENNRTCRKKMPVDEMYQAFIYRYISNREEALQDDIREEKYAKPSGTLNKSFYRDQIRKTQSWLKMLYEKHPGYRTYKVQQKRLEEQKKEESKRAKEEKERLRKENALWKSASEGFNYPMYYLKGVDANIRNKEGLTPLMVAVRHGHSFVIDTWAMDGVVADVWAKDPAGKTAWDYIKKPKNRTEEIFSDRMYGALRLFEVYQIVNNRAKIVASGYHNNTDLLDITIDGDVCRNFTFPQHTRCQALKPPAKHDIFKAIKTKDDALFDKLLPTVKDLSIQNKNHYSLLWASILYHNPYALDRLLKKGADKYEIDPMGLKTPVYWTAMHNDTKSLKILLDNGADVHSANIFGDTAIFTAMYKCNNFEAITILLDHSANPYGKNKRGKTVFDKAPVFCKDKEDIVKMKKLLKERSTLSQ